jgi:hypothetical protein
MYVPAAQIDRVYDLNSFRGPGPQRGVSAPGRPGDPAHSDPNVYFVRLRP